ncbi:MAG: pepSY-associated TM [Rhodospirillaceae bacterium]|nr:MAG: pepSY-associated TM [Rhodospirillaceae bacterium]TNC95261.1 MAG: pepSY-associated TM helix [Stygiobacter sp.]
MRSDIIRTYKAVHTWTGITTGLLLFVAFYAGALTMFKAPLLRWAEPAVLAPAPAVLSGDQLIARTLAQRPETAKEFTLHLEGPLRLSWQKTRRDDSPFIAAPDADGSIAIGQTRSAGLDWLVDVIHRTGGLPLDVETGTMVTGLAAGLYTVALVSGLIILLPSLIKDLFALRLGHNLKRLWLDAHNLVGLFSLPFHLVMALSAVVFGWHDLLYDSLNEAVYKGQMRTVMRASNPPAPFAGDKSTAVPLGVDVLLAHVAVVAPGFRPTSLQYRDFGTKAATVRVSGEDPRYLVRGHGFLLLGAVSGSVIGTEYLPGQQGVWASVVSSFFALHFGSFGGDTVRWGYFALGLAGAFLFYSGNLLWIESRRRRQRGGDECPGQSRSSRTMAALTVGICLGCVAGLSAAIVAARWLQGVFIDVNGWSRGIYYIIFVLALFIALRHGAARAAAPLLGLAALCTAAIPLSSLLLWRSAVPGIDVVAACGAVVLAVLARKTAARAAHGPADSVWSAAHNAKKV